MKLRTLALLIRIILIGCAICGIALLVFVFPNIGQSFANAYPEFSGAYLPWMIFLCIAAVPCYTVVVMGFLIAKHIARDNAFSADNSRLLKGVAIAAAVDSVFFFIGNLVLLFLNMSHPGILLLSLIIVFIGAAICVASMVLSSLSARAADIQDENALTI